MTVDQLLVGRLWSLTRFYSPLSILRRLPAHWRNILPFLYLNIQHLRVARRRDAYDGLLVPAPSTDEV